MVIAMNATQTPKPRRQSSTPPSAVDAARGGTVSSEALNEALSHREAFMRCAIEAVPARGTKQWVLRHYHQLLPLIADQVCPMLTIAALHGARKNPKHEFFGNSPTSWLAATAQIDLRLANTLVNAAQLIYTPSTIKLGAGADHLSPQERTVIQRKHQDRLRRRLVELGVNLAPIAVLARESDNLNDECKHLRLQIIHEVLDTAEDFSPKTLKQLVSRRVVACNREHATAAKRMRAGELRFNDADEYGFATAYSYGPQATQDEHRALLADGEAAITKLFQEAGLVNPFEGLSLARRTYKVNDVLLNVGSQALNLGLVGAYADGTVTVDTGRLDTSHLNAARLNAARLNAARLNAARGKLRQVGTASFRDGSMRADVADVQNAAKAPGAADVSNTAELSGSSESLDAMMAGLSAALGEAGPRATVSQASMVIYASLGDVLAKDWTQRPAFRNDGNRITLEKASRLAPQGCDHIAILGEPPAHAGIHRIDWDSATDALGVVETVDTATDTQGRFATRLQRILMGLMQPYCAHPGCTVPASRCQAHHLIPHSEGGKTSIDNMVLLCRFHHSKNDDSRRNVHQGHYDKDQWGIAYWQQHGDPAPKPQYNQGNLNPPGFVHRRTRKQHDSKTESGDDPPA